MKANLPKMPKCWDQLRESDKEMIRKIYDDATNVLINQQIDKEEVEMQKTWILYGAVALAENGASKDDILVWIGSWKRIYRANGRMKTKEEQDQFIKDHLPFFDGDYPFEFIESLERC